MIKLCIIIIYNGVLYENNSHNIRIIQTNCQIILNKYQTRGREWGKSKPGLLFSKVWLLVFHDFKTQEEEEEEEEKEGK